MTYTITNFYKFTPVAEESLPALKTEFLELAAAHNLEGLMLIAPEGVNATIAGTEQNIAAYEKVLEEKFGEIWFKRSKSDVKPFRRFKIKLKKEIVTIKNAKYNPEDPEYNHVSPEEWHRLMEEEDVVVVDNRNWYETRIGKFKDALDPNIEQFSDLPEYLEKTNIPKNKKVLIYCTSGIRCDKGINAFTEKGYKEVYQLDGGIINYMEKFPEGNFEGECFVFDHRVSLDKDLKPSERYGLCPHCGNPGDVIINCNRCSKHTKACEPCLKNSANHTCSKNCKNILLNQKTAA